MVKNILRFTHPCGCVAELFVDSTNPSPNQEPSFLLMNDVCGKHAHMKSSTKGPDHDIKSAQVLAAIEDAKKANLDDVDKKIEKATRQLDKSDLQQARNYVVQFNQRLDVEWNELVSNDHAFDEHIHEHIKKEGLNA